MATENGIETEGLRQRNIPVQAPSSEEARQAVLDLNALEDKNEEKGADKKTFGRTPDGTGELALVCQILDPLV